MKLSLKLHLEGLVEAGEEIPEARGIESYLDAERDSAGEDCILTHIAMSSVVPTRAELIPTA